MTFRRDLSLLERWESYDGGSKNTFGGDSYLANYGDGKKVEGGSEANIWHIREKKDESSSSVDIRLSGGYLLVLKPGDIWRQATVAKFHQVLGEYMALTCPDSELYEHNDLPDIVKRDLLMTKILNNIKANRFAEALPDFDRLEKLDAKQPESFYFHYIQALDKTGRNTEAKTRAITFLKRFGDKSKYYNDILQIIAK